MRAPVVVVSDPFRDDGPKMPFIQKNQPIQAFSTNGADDSFTGRIGLRRAWRRLQRPDPQLADGLVEMAREDAVTIMKQEFVLVWVPDHLPQLLQGPGRRRLRGDIAMNQAAAAVLDDHEYVQLAKRRRNCDEVVTGNDSLSVQAQKARPAQVASRPTSGRNGRYFLTVRGET